MVVTVITLTPSPRGPGTETAEDMGWLGLVDLAHPGHLADWPSQPQGHPFHLPEKGTLSMTLEHPPGEGTRGWAPAAGEGGDDQKP